MLRGAKKKILIVDDEQSIRDSMQLLLKSSFNVEALESGEELLDQIEEINPDLVFLDLYLPGLDGLETLRALQEKNISTPIVMLSGNNTVKTAVEAMKLGAIDYVKKPFDIEELTNLIVETLAKGLVSSGALKINLKASSKNKKEIIGQSDAIVEVLEKLSLVAPHDATVLITGESGTGKELIARRIHDQSLRAEDSFIALNCAALPENLLESELFGYEKGAFTGAENRKIGLIELADAGTLFLDEIGELSPALQVKLLRFLQEKEFYRLGAINQAIKVDVRIIAATNRDLEQQVAEMSFRSDLYYRINVVNLDLPPLRDRAGDIDLLLRHFSNIFSQKYAKNLNFSEEVQKCFQAYDWPGNVREFENTIESLYAVLASGEVQVQDLSPRIRGGASSNPSEQDSEIIIDENFDFQEAGKQFEKSMILQALKKTNNVQTRAAKLLGITRRMLKYKIDKLDIDLK